ncbi:MAG: nucleoside-diphosphate sugar epimerase/dehydratase [Chloroflexi bacterium OHK40]
MRFPLVNLPVRNRYFFVADLVLLPLAAYASIVIRLESLNLSPFWSGFGIFALLCVGVTLLVFWRLGIYARYWRYASLDELLLLASGVVLADLIVAGIVLLLAASSVSLIVPRSVPVIYALLALVVTAAPRLVARLLGRRSAMRRKAARGMAAASRVLIMGAGSAGAMMVRELRENPQVGMEVVGFVDDDPHKRDVRIHGVPVLGGQEDIPRLVRQYQVQQVIIAMPSVSGKTIRRIVEICERAGVSTKSMPGMYELLDGRVRVSQLRDVQIEDLLRRKPVRTNTAAVEQLLRGKRVLITGGGGSIGSELCRQVLRCEPAELIVLGHGENSVFSIEQELRQHLSTGTRLSTVIADIRFAERLSTVFEHFRPDVVFHAAAHKHVPLMEANPVEAITNNVLGTRNVLQAAMSCGVGHFVMISTDKAVNPTSVMGASKRTAELLVHQAAMASGKPYVAVRFGNVLGSRGSVVLTFKQQIAAGGPVTVTHPEMVRYFMTIPEAVQLVLQAATLGKGGEVFTLDMSEPVKIVDLARDMIELSGLEVGRDIDIVFTGMRPGEKLYEELFIAGENYQRTVHEKIFIAANASNLVPFALDEGIRTLELAAATSDVTLIVRALKALIPSFQHASLGTVDAAESVAAPALPYEPLIARAVGSHD